jgi:terminase small subunit-like protein
VTCRSGHPPRHPDFAAGNTVAVRHGAYSPRRVDPLAAEVVEQALADVDWLQPCDRPAVWAWARSEARVQLLGEWLAEQGGDVDDDGSVRPAAELLNRLEARAESLRSKLGLDPLSRARLGRDVAATRVDLEALRAEGQAMLDARSPSLTLVDDEDPS